MNVIYKVQALYGDSVSHYYFDVSDVENIMTMLDTYENISKQIKWNRSEKSKCTFEKV